MVSLSSSFRVLLCSQTPLYIGSCIKHLIAGDSKEKLFVSFRYDPEQGLFVIDHEKVFARAPTKDLAGSAVYQGLLLEHSRTCPCYTMNLNPDVYSFASSDVFVRLACSTLILDSNNHLLLTRRDKRLRSFPGAWVNPGGRLDPKESLDKCALRELDEEVGISLTQKETSTKGGLEYLYLGRDCEVKPFMVYESVYPTHLDIGFPKVQYIVVFYYVKIGCEYTKIKAKIQDSEIDKAIWLDLPAFMKGMETKKASGGTIHCHNITSNKVDTLPTEVLEGVYPNAVNEGIGEGHLIAMRYYYNKFLKSSMEVEDST